jgi:glycosyltransferase involved in cell wall biosynthesis
VKILVYPHDMAMGGSQLNAVEIGAAVQRLGHEVVVFGRPGALQSRIDELDLEFVISPPLHRRPTPAVVAALRKLIRHRNLDVVHAYEWPPALESRLAVPGTAATCVATVMSMAVAPFIPRQIPLIVGTAQIADAERRFGRRDVTLIEPPVDIEHNSPSAAEDLAPLRGRLGLAEDDLVVVCVSRLANELKLEGLLTAIEVVPSLHPRARLLVVGDGPARGEVEMAAGRANAHAGRKAVVLAGELLDPRPAYALADVALGMGGSALRAMAFAKPVVVQGERGFWELLTPQSLDQFLWTGWYGVGADPAHGATRLAAHLGPLLTSRQRREELGRFSREVTSDRFSLQRAGELQVQAYVRALTCASSSFDVVNDLKAGASFASYKTRRRAQRVFRRAATDDFNSRPVAATATAEPRDGLVATGANARTPGGNRTSAAHASARGERTGK